MQRYGVDRDSLVEAFGRARDDWMASDFQGWLGANDFYEVRVSMCCYLSDACRCAILVGVGGFCFFFFSAQQDLFFTQEEGSRGTPTEPFPLRVDDIAFVPV